MGFPPTDKSLEGVLKDTRDRLDLVERRLAFGSGGGSVPYDANPGMIMPFAGATVPDGWLLCDGTAVSRSTYATLFAAVGTVYGAGDGSTTFNVPNLKGRVPVGKDAAQTEFDVLGEVGGAKTVALTANQLAAHSHEFFMDDFAYNAGFVKRANVAYDATSTNVGAGGIFSTNAMIPGNNNANAAVAGGEAHNNLQPYVITNYIISTGDGVGGGGTRASSGGGGTTIVQSGLVLLRPTSVQGGTIDGNQVKFTNVTAISVNNIFNGALYDDYLIEVRMSPITNGGWLRMRKGGVDTITNTYGNQQTWNDSAGTLKTLYSATSGWIFANSIGVEEKFSIQLNRPDAPPGESVYGAIEQTIQVSDGLRQGSNRGTHAANNYDGFSIQSAGAAGFSGTITIYGKSKVMGGVVPPQGNLWQELKMASPGGIRPLNSGALVWDGVHTGNLGLLLDAAKRTITIPKAGSYRFVQHVGIATSAGGAANMNAIVNGVQHNPSLTYGTAGPAGAFNVEGEFYLTTTAPNTTVVFVANAPAGGVYDWSWLRVEDLNPVAYGTALAIQQGSTTERNALHGVPATDLERVSLANRKVTWFNTDSGFFEIYYATTGLAGLTAKGLASGFPSGWYPAAGSLIWGTCTVLNAQSVASGEVRINMNTGELVGGMTTGNNVMIVPVGGIYEVIAHLYRWAPPQGTYRAAIAFDVVGGAMYANGTTSASWDIASVPRRSRIAAGVQIGLKTGGDAGDTIQGQTWPALEVRYIGPPLANG